MYIQVKHMVKIYTKTPPPEIKRKTNIFNTNPILTEITGHLICSYPFASAMLSEQTKEVHYVVSEL